jgi:hypothetical protein
MTEVLISEDFKRPLLWDHRIKDYKNRISPASHVFPYDAAKHRSQKRNLLAGIIQGSGGMQESNSQHSFYSATLLGFISTDT